MADTPAARFYPTAFPPPQKLRLEAIHESALVYQNRFRLVRDLTFGSDQKLRPVVDAAGTVTVEGAFRYQACDDRVCYVPASIPLKWTFRFEALDRERAPVELQHKAR